MQTDHYYEIGKTHFVCEDYASSGEIEVELGNKIYYAIVSDGCSSSKDVDVGSRILTKSTEVVIHELLNHNFNGLKGLKGLNVDFLHEEIGNRSISKANSIKNSFGCLGSNSLDCTLLLALSDGNNHRIFIYGDGLFFFKDMEGIHVVNISYDANAPYYLSYSLDQSRHKKYCEIENNKKCVKSYIITENGIINLVETYFNSTAPLFFNLSGKMNFISVCSDGFDTYWENHRNKLQLHDIIKECSSYRNFQGEFVKRRMGSMKRSMDSNNKIHNDDIAIATICMGKNE